MNLFEFIPATSRHHTKQGWLESNFSFSFASWYDPSKMGVGALRVLNDDIIAPNSGFGMHPHRDMEILTIVLEGSVAHKDSMGNEEIIPAGEIQIMSAGTGVVHSEFNPSSEKPLKLIQTWLIPNQMNLEPRYDQMSIKHILDYEGIIPIVSFDERGESLKIFQNCIIYIGSLNKDKKYFIPNTESDLFYIMCLEGTIEVNNQIMNKRDACIIRSNEINTITAIDSSKVLIYDLNPSF